MIASGWRQPGSTFKIFTYGGMVEQLAEQVLAAKSAPATLDEISAEVLERCTVLDAPIFVPLGRGRGVKKIENFHSRSEPEYRGNMTCRIALGESRNTAAMRAGARAGIKNVIDLTYRLGMPGTRSTCFSRTRPRPSAPPRSIRCRWPRRPRS